MGKITTRNELDSKIQHVVARFSGEIAFAAKNLATGEEIRVNAGRVYATASVIKLAILVELFRQVREEGLDLEEGLEFKDTDAVFGSGILKELTPGLRLTLRDLATLMIIVSDNTTTNMLIDRLGGLDCINRTVQEQYGLTTIVMHNRIDFERIGTDARRLGEASAADLMRLVELLLRGQVVDPEASGIMLDIMRRQQYLDQVPRYFNYNPYAREFNFAQEIEVACKTGFGPGVHADAGAVFLPQGVSIAYCAMLAYDSPFWFIVENEGAAMNGILGRLMLEYWWPDETGSTGNILSSPYFERYLSAS